MKRTLLASSIVGISAFWLLLVSIYAQPIKQVAPTTQGVVKTENRPVSAYTGIRIESPVSLTFTVSSSPTLTVTTQENILRRVTTSVVDGQLIIRIQPAVDPIPEIQITTGSPALDLLEIAGSANVRANGLSGKSIDLRISGSGTVAMTGQTDRFNASVSGSGNLDLAGLKAFDLNVDLSGSGQVRAFASRSARAIISGSGSVVIAGNPLQRSVQQSGSGTVIFQ